MIIIEMDSGSQAFHALNAATSDPAIYKLRIALDDGEFKIKFNEGLWTAELAGVTIGAQGNLAQLQRDIVSRRTEPIQLVKWTYDGVTVRVGEYRGWTVTASKLDDFITVSNERDAHEGGTHHGPLEDVLRSIDAEVDADA